MRLMSLAPSKQFLLFLILFISGLVIGSYINVGLSVLIFLLIIWLFILLSGHDEPLHTISISLTGILMGWSVWLLTKGEPWLNVPILNSVSDLLGKLRDLVVGRVNLALIEPHGSLLNGILIGNRIKLDKEMIKIFQPAESFVMDICLTDDELKIIEIGTIGCAGLYKANVPKLLMALEDFYNDKI